MLAISQQNFINYMLDENNVVDGLSHGHLPPNQVMNIYRNNYYYTLTTALSSTYSCVKRLVGKEFFEFLCKHYIQYHPSTSGNIIDYGENFPLFVRDFEHCKTMPYLADVATFEYEYEQCYHNPKQVYFLSSDYVIIEIWQLDDESDEINVEQKSYIKIYNNLGVIVERITQKQYNRQSKRMMIEER